MTMTIERPRGDTYADIFTILSENTGLALNIGSCTFLLTVDPDNDPSSSADNLYQLTGTVTDALNGVVEFAPSAGQADLVGNFWFDVQMIDGTGRKRTIVSGPYKYTQDVTK